MTSEAPAQAFVWIWLPGAHRAGGRGSLDEEGGESTFVYGAATWTATMQSPSIPQSCH